MSDVPTASTANGVADHVEPHSRQRRSGVQSLAGRILPPLLVFVLVIVLWDLGVRIFQPKEFLLPPPLRVAQALRHDWPQLWSATLNTGVTALSGFGLSLSVGCLMAFIMAQARVLERSFFPYAIFLQTVPIIAIAPIILSWFGNGRGSVIIVSFIISLFPIVTNVTAGLTTPRREWLELMRVYHANWWQMLWKVRLPASLPHIVIGAKISAGLSVVGAIVGEYFTSQSGTSFGLAYLVDWHSKNLNMPELMATTLMSAILGLAIFITVTLLGGLVLKLGHFQEDLS